MSPRLSPFPVGAGTSPLIADDFTAWASNGWVATGDDVIKDDWGDTDHIRLFVEYLGFWGNDPELPQEPGARSTRLTKTYDGLPANRFVVVRVDVAFYAQDFGAAGKWVGMEVNGVQFAPNVAASGTITPASGQIVGYGMTNGDGEITVAFGCDDITVSCDLHIQFDNLEVTTPAAELADIYYDAGVGYVNGNAMSITRGGISFDPGETWEDFDFPGKVAPVEGCDELVSARPVMRTRFMLTGEYQFTVYRPDGIWANGTLDGERVYTLAAARAALASGMYIEFVAIWPRQRRDYIGVRFRKALCRMTALGGTDKDENGIEVEIGARIPAGESIRSVPYEIFTLPADSESVT